MTILTGYIVRETKAAVAFVRESDTGVNQVKPIWLPRKKIMSMHELDLTSRRIVTAQDGERVGVPHSLDVDLAFLNRIGVLT
jgi:hypothetical protein